MAVNIESFLSIEQSLSTRLYNGWTRDNGKLVTKIARHSNLGEVAEASSLVQQLDITPAVARNEKYIELMGMSAILFGATRFHKTAKNTSFSKDRAKPEILNDATRGMKTALVDLLNSAIRVYILQLIATQEKQQIAARDASVQKADNPVTVSTFNLAVAKTVKGTIDVAASLYTSRLASWGFTSEAQVLGVVEYTVSEQLDIRTCPVCQEMHGKTFSVDVARWQLEQWLTTSHAGDLKALAPWPSQTKDALAALRKMSNDELVDRGWHVPPYHPLCRGVLVRKNTAIRQEATEATQPQQEGSVFDTAILLGLGSLATLSSGEE